ncbi:hypothetical protein QBC46DRAFT_346284 [Diplogelasinospora grovesii]|uniref:Uncharacterized protein n=1 Tax=Diplogelasinospora grovesii TaxID=303347 RepID=A0AAN6MYJ1_9PEZI|nr:hypothetical protein QBC46DRAFT_346284 [Diplogelasinospora grovesii]
MLAVGVHYAQADLQHKYSSTHTAWDEGSRKKYESEALTALQSGIHGLDNLQQDMSNAVNQQSSFVFPGAGDFFMKRAAFNAAGDLLLELSFEQKAIIIDDDFHLQVAAPHAPDIHGKWLKLEDSSVVLVVDQKDATLFQLDNGSLVVDQSGLPAGPRSVTKTAPDSDDVQDLIFVAAKPDSEEESSDDETTEKKLECSTTGSKFDYSFNISSGLWYDTFALDTTGKHIQLFKGDTDAPGPYRVFNLSAVY